MDRVLTKKGALAELAIVTVGVLIALSFDGARGWLRDGELLEAARANLTRELRENKVAIERFRMTLADRQKELTAMRRAADRLISGQPVNGELSLNFAFAEVASAAQATAQMTGAFGLMEYEEVNRYAAIYGLQATFIRMQEETTSMLRDVLSRLWVLDADKPPMPAVAAWIDEISRLGSQVFLLDQFAEGLVSGYGRALAEAAD